MKIVAVTGCLTGIARTYMAAERLEKAARKLGCQIKVETQGAMGIENELSQQEIDSADVVILTTDVALKWVERFARVKTVNIPPQAVMKDPGGILATLCGASKRT